MKKAFVIMPFGEEFDSVYAHLIEPCLKKAEFSVCRADEILNQQSIMNDVIGGIDESDVVVADLSGANANVYYELGIAHAVRRNVVLLARHGERAPFDIAEQRAIRYGIEFDKMEEAKERFQALMHEVSDGSVKFGSPVISYGEIAIGPRRSVSEDADRRSVEEEDRDALDEDEDDDLGILDFRVILEDGMAVITGAAEGVGQEFRTIGSEAERASETITSTTDAKKARKATRVLAAALEESAASIWSHSADFGNGLNEIRRASKGLVDQGDWPSVASEDEAEEAREALETLDSLPVQADSLVAQMESLVDTLTGIPKIERKFNQARRKLLDVIVEFSRKVEASKAVVEPLARGIQLSLDRSTAGSGASS